MRSKVAKMLARHSVINPESNYKQMKRTWNTLTVPQKVELKKALLDFEKGFADG